MSELSGRLLGDFVVRDRLGQGGFGEVYRAEQTALGREAVIKVLLQRHRDRPHLVTRFLREARLASCLDHPYAAHVYAFGAEPDGLLWIAMELVRGTTLAQRLAHEGPLPLDELVPFVERICEVLGAAHERGIVHRDIKPANIMVLERAGRRFPKLLDFGIAKQLIGEPAAAPSSEGPAPVAVGAADDTADWTPPEGAPPADGADDDLTGDGATMGSPPYMAPEQWSDATASDARADIYSLGAVVYEALTGSRPFSGGVRDLSVAHQRDLVPQLGPGFPAELDQVIARAMAKRPEDRFASALDLAAGLRAAAQLGGEAPLPALEKGLRRVVLIEYPQPIAEAVAAIDSARNAHQAKAAFLDVVTTSVRYVALVALATRAQVGPDIATDAALVELLRAASRGELSSGAWLAVARAALRPHEGHPDALPIPPLGTVLAHAGWDLVARAEAWQAERGESDADIRERLEDGLPALGQLLGALGFLADHPLVTPGEGESEWWMGVRARRAPLATEWGAPQLIGRDGRPRVVLSPLVQIASPSPGSPPEVFLFSGRGARDGRWVALPGRFERQGDAIWGWLRGLLPEEDGVSDRHQDDAVSFRGLLPFTVADADAFVGREREIEAVSNRLLTEPFLAVVGPSGAGKTSFVHAGLAASLADRWQLLSVRPGAQPLAALRACLQGAGISRLDATSLRAAARAQRPILLVVDQLEELFTLGASAAEREAFAEIVVAAARSPDDPVRVVVTLRDDFLMEANAIAALATRLPRAIVLLGTPPEDQLRRIVTEPIRRAGYVFDEPGLPDEMVRDVAGRPGALALLSFATSRLWEARDRQFRQLLARAYRGFGGVGGALAQHAEATLAALPRDAIGPMRELFRQLVTAQGTRASLQRRELVELIGPRADALVETVVAARLVTSEEDVEGAARVEIIHEALIAAWPRLAEWRREDSDGLRLRDELRSAARQWHERGRPRALLWRDELLTEYRRWRAGHPTPLTQTEEDFAAVSLRDAARIRRWRRGLLATAVTFLASAIVVLAWMNHRTEVQRATTVTLRARAEQLGADAERRLTEQYLQRGGELLRSGDLTRAAAYLLEVRRRGAADHGVELMLSLTSRAFLGERVRWRHDGKVRHAAFTADGHAVLTTSADGAAVLWGLDGGQRRRFSTGGSPVAKATLTADGSTLVLVGDDGKVQILEARTGTRLHALDVGEASPLSALSDDGALLAAGATGGKLGIWDVATGRSLAALPNLDRGVTSVLFRPRSHALVVITEDGAVHEWEARAGFRDTVIDDLRGVMFARLSSDGRRLVTTHVDRRVRFWDTRGWRLLAVGIGHEAYAEHAAFSPDQRRVVTASRDATARVWSVADGRQEVVLTGHEWAVKWAEFDADGRRVVTASADGTARVWDPQSGALLAVAAGHTASVRSASFSPDGRQLVTASFDGTARLWDIVPLARRHVLRGHDRDLVASRFAPDGKTLLTVGQDGRAIVWDVGSGTELGRTDANGVGVAEGTLFSGERALLRTRGGEALSWRWRLGPPSGDACLGHAEPFAATAEATLVRETTGTVRICAPGGEPLGTFAAPEARGLALDPTGRRVVRTEGAEVITTTYAGVPLWRTRVDVIGAPVVTSGRLLVVGRGGAESLSLPDGARQRRFAEVRGPSQTALDAAGRQLAAIGSEGFTRVWALDTGELVHAFFEEAPTQYALALSPDGRLLATTSEDRALWLWDTASGRALIRLDGHDNIAGQCAFDSAGKVVATSGWDGTAMLWSAPEILDDASLERFACRVPFALENGTLVDRRDTCSP
jgi:WD40 repeat protein/tRNA A-37 threonylcarbamoyl transferase component Bud32